MRRSILFILFITAAMTTFLLLPLHARHARQRIAGNDRQHNAQLQNLHVTDLCLATEARYTRHPAMADRHAPFQEHPLALEHFPSGSLVMPNMTERNKR